jgi:hypothetical protein
MHSDEENQKHLKTKKNEEKLQKKKFSVMF